MRMTAVISGGIKLSFVTAGLFLASSLGASAQSLTPMRGEAKSFTDQFAFRVYPANPYPRPIRVEVHVYDENFVPIQAAVMPPAAMLTPEDNRSVMVMVPFEGRLERKVRICAEAVPFEQNATRLRTQVCGRFIAHRVR